MATSPACRRQVEGVPSRGGRSGAVPLLAVLLPAGLTLLGLPPRSSSSSGRNAVKPETAKLKPNHTAQRRTVVTKSDLSQMCAIKSFLTFAAAVTLPVYVDVAVALPLAPSSSGCSSKHPSPALCFIAAAPSDVAFPCALTSPRRSNALHFSDTGKTHARRAVMRSSSTPKMISMRRHGARPPTLLRPRARIAPAIKAVGIDPTPNQPLRSAIHRPLT